MDNKVSREQYRLRTYGGPDGRPIQSSLPTSANNEPGVPIRTDRAIIQFDADAFYAQVEENRNPRLKNVPLAVTQKYLIVTCNQAARRLGVTKLQGVTDAKEKVPSLVLVNGEDLTPYRQASKRIFSVLARFGIAERLGMDEVFVDVTAEVQARIQRGFLSSTYNGHIHTAEMALRQETKHRPMDLRVARSAFGEVALGAVSYESAGLSAPWEASLKIASHIAAEARAAVKAETGFRTSAGISCSKMLAKLVSGMHKPDDQTVILPCHAAAFVATLPVRAIPGRIPKTVLELIALEVCSENDLQLLPGYSFFDHQEEHARLGPALHKLSCLGIGWKMDQELTAVGVTNADDLRGVSLAKLTKAFGERTAKYMYSACRGEDTTPVVQSGAPKSITVEDSFKSCTTFSAALHVLQILAPDLISRLDEDYEEHSRRAGTMTLKWRQKKQGWSRSSSSIPMPIQWHTSKEQQADALVQVSLSILRKNLAQPFSLTLLNIGATNFSAPLNAQKGVPKAFKNFFGGQRSTNGSKQAAGVAGEELQQAARVAMSARRDYGANPKGQPLAKSNERALSEAGRGRPAAASTGNSVSISDEDAFPEEDDWGFDSAMGPEHAVSMPEPSRTANTELNSTAARLPFHSQPSRPEQASESKDRTLQNTYIRTNSNHEHSMQPTAEAHAGAQNLLSDRQMQSGKSGYSLASCSTLDGSDANRVPAAAVGLMHCQQIDEHVGLGANDGALPALSNNVRAQHESQPHSQRPGNGLVAAKSRVSHAKQPPILSKASEPNTADRSPIGLPQPEGQSQLSDYSPGTGTALDAMQHQQQGACNIASAAWQKLSSMDEKSSASHSQLVQAQNRKRHSDAASIASRSTASQGVAPTELQKLQALSKTSQQRPPQWLTPSEGGLSADLRLAQKLQQEEVRWHQIHTRANSAKRKPKKESTLDAFFKRPAQ